MTQPLENGNAVHAFKVQHGGHCVTKIMESYLLALCPFQGLLHPAAGVIGGQRTVLLHRGREHPAGIYCPFVGFEHLQQCPRQDELSDGSFGFRLCDVGLTLDKANGFVDLQLPSLHVQILPLQGQNLPQTQAGAQLQQEELIVAVLLRLDEEPLHFLLGQDVHFPTFLRRQLAANGGIGADQPLLHRLLQCGTAGRMADPHHPIRQAGAEMPHPDQTSAGL